MITLKLGRTSQAHRCIILARSNTHQSKSGLCLLDSHPSYSAPVGPNCPFNDTDAYSQLSDSRLSHVAHSGVRPDIVKQLTEGLIRLSLLAKKSSEVAITSPPSADDETSVRQLRLTHTSAYIPVRKGRSFASNSSSGMAL
jgi:hypothetical protein